MALPGHATESGPPRPEACASQRLRVQLWSYNYDPEPTGIGIVSTALATGLRDIGHEVEVVAAHPHYPEPRWGSKLRPYREWRHGVRVWRLPLWIGRESAAARYRQELSFLASQSLATPFLTKPDVLISASPSFPALLPAVIRTRRQRIPWVLWLHDLLPDGATATGLVDENSLVLKLSRRLEREAYAAADHIVVLSRAFTKNLLSKGVANHKIELIYDPATLPPARSPIPEPPQGTLRLLSMGNIGYSQGLTPLIRALEEDKELSVNFRITGTGVAAESAAAEILSDRIEMLGLIERNELEQELQAADVGVVTQQYEGSEFNIPSKLMNFMAHGLPVLAAVNPMGEVARIIREAEAGWVIDSSEPSRFSAEIRRLSDNPSEVASRARASLDYANQNFSAPSFAKRFDRALQKVVAEYRNPS